MLLSFCRFRENRFFGRVVWWRYCSWCDVDGKRQKVQSSDREADAVALLGDKTGADDVDYYCSPARATDLSGLPDTNLEVGQLDVFLYDTINYAHNLSNGGVMLNCMFKCLSGMLSYFDKVSIAGQKTKRALGNRYTYLNIIRVRIRVLVQPWL